MNQMQPLNSIYLDSTAKKIHDQHLRIRSLAENIDKKEDAYAIASECSILLRENADLHEYFHLLRSEQQSLLCGLDALMAELDLPSFDTKRAAQFYGMATEYDHNHQIIEKILPRIEKKNKRISELTDYMTDLSLEIFTTEIIQ